MENEDFIQSFEKKHLVLNSNIHIGQHEVSCDWITKHMTPLLKDERSLRLKTVADQRSFHLVPVLENIYDRGNVSAVMRSAEGLGFIRMMLIESEQAKFKAANRVSKGAEKWLDLDIVRTSTEAVKKLKAQGYQIVATDLNTPYTIADVDFSMPTAVVLGNEKDGVSQEMLSLVDQSFKIPMTGFSQSFNISVAASVLFYHVSWTQKDNPKLKVSEEEAKSIFANYVLRTFDNPESIVAKLKDED